MVPWAHPSLQPKWHVDRFSHLHTAHPTVSHYFTMGRYVSQINIAPWGIGSPSNTWYIGLTRVINSNGISILSTVFVWVPNAMLYNALSVEKKPQILPLPLGISSPRQSTTEPWSYATSTKDFVKIAHVVREICSQKTDRTDRHTCSLQYFALAPTG